MGGRSRRRGWRDLDPLGREGRRFAHGSASIAPAGRALQRDPDQRRNFYERQLAAGKHKKVALIACIRKIVTTLNAMLRDNTPWNAATT